MSAFPKYNYNGTDLLLIPGKNFSKINLLKRLKKMNIKDNLNFNKLSKADLYNIYDESLKDENNIEKILDFLISDTNSELNINLSPSNFKRKKEKVYQNTINDNNINGNDQNLEQKKFNEIGYRKDGFPIYINNNIVRDQIVYREDGFPVNNNNGENISLIKQNESFNNNNLFSNQSLNELSRNTRGGVITPVQPVSSNVQFLEKGRIEERGIG